MKESIEDIAADIEFQYGKSNTEKNIEYILSLYSERLQDGVLDDNIPVPSNEAAAKAILLILDRPELPWETICKERRVKNVMEYLFIRATGHYEEVHDFVSGLLRHYIKGITPQMVLTFMNIWKHFFQNFMKFQKLRPVRFKTAGYVFFFYESRKLFSVFHSTFTVIQSNFGFFGACWFQQQRT